MLTKFSNFFLVVSVSLLFSSFPYPHALHLGPPTTTVQEAPLVPCENPLPYPPTFPRTSGLFLFACVWSRRMPAVTRRQPCLSIVLWTCSSFGLPCGLFNPRRPSLPHHLCRAFVFFCWILSAKGGDFHISIRVPFELFFCRILKIRRGFRVQDENKKRSSLWTGRHDDIKRGPIDGPCRE